MRIIGIDPGTARLGWSVIEETPAGPIVVASGCLTTPKQTLFHLRLRMLYDDLNGILASHHPEGMSIEDLFFATNAKTAIAVGQARGVALLTAALSDIPLYSYAPLAVKRTICGTGTADKKQVQYMVTRLLKLESVPDPDDIADAMAVALTHIFSYRLSRKLNGMRMKETG